MESSSTVSTSIKALSTMKIKEKVKYDWIISNFGCILELHCNQVLSYNLTSPDFSINNKKRLLQCMELRFNGTKSQHPNWLSLVFKSNPIIRIESEKFIFQVFIINQHEKVLKSWRRCHIGYFKTYEINEFCQYVEISKKLILDDSLRIVCEFTAYEEALESLIIDESRSKKIKLEEAYKSYYKNRNNGDFTFIVGDQRLKAHKFVLISRCCIFALMSDDNVFEMQGNEMNITNIRPEIFDKMLEFLYTDDVRGGLNGKDAEDLLRVAEMYLLDHLKQICQEALFKFMTVENASNVHQLTRRPAIRNMMSIIKTLFKDYLKN